MIEPPAVAWRAILPVKVLADAKSRMAADGPATMALAFAFFQDTLAAVLACDSVGEVVVVTADLLVETWARDHGCIVVSDDGHPGINAAARWAASSRQYPAPTAIIVSDLPCLRAGELDQVIRLAHDHPSSFVADADGSGTTIWLSSTGAHIDPHFGPDSRAAHRDAGAVDLVALHPDRTSALATARRDVDTASALSAAQRLGLGRHSLIVFVASRTSTTAEIIVTVASSDSETLTLVDESGVIRSVPWALATGAGLIAARPGQRLAAILLPTGEIDVLRLP